MSTLTYAAQNAQAKLAPFTIDRRALNVDDVAIDILFCGVCHSDLHMARNEWGIARYPVVPGHEIVGRVTQVGSAVSTFKQGDIVGVGCMVDSCGSCPSCQRDFEQFCQNGFTMTYGGKTTGEGENTYGGYAADIVVKEHFVLKITHAEQDLAAVAPLLCAGITTWSPLRHWNAGPGKKVGIVGIGGLGHMGIKLARALGAHVVAFTTSDSKRDEALKLGAHEVVVSKNAQEMAAHANSFDLIINSVAATHDLNPYMGLLKVDGNMTLLGVPAEPHPPLNVMGMLFKRNSLSGSLIGGIAETQEMLDFCAKHNITSDIEMIAMQDIETAYARMLKNDVRYRFVIDMATLKAA